MPDLRFWEHIVAFTVRLLAVSWILQLRSLAQYPEDALCLPVRVVNGFVSPFDYSVLGPYERVPSDFQFIPLGNINVDAAWNGFVSNRELFSAIIPAHRYHTIVPCPYVWHTAPWKNPQEPAMDSTITIYDSPAFALAGAPSSDTVRAFIGEAFRPGPATSRAALR